MAIVEAAERLFAERGLQAVSLREVSSAAGQRNNIAAQYHFSDRAGLVAAVYAARMGQVNERRQRRIDALDARAPAVRPGDLVSALVEPLAEVVVGERTWYARFLARALWDPLAEEVLAGHPAASSLRRLQPYWRASLAHLAPELRRNRLDQLGALVIGTLAGWEWARERDTPRLPPALLVGDLVATGVALVMAPAPEAGPTPCPPVDPNERSARHHEDQEHP
jgi:AcrR family transcriptional regulator